jgi:hypothetical protein
MKIKNPKLLRKLATKEISTQLKEAVNNPPKTAPKKIESSRETAAALAQLTPKEEIIKKLTNGIISLKHSSKNNYSCFVLTDKGKKQSIGTYIDGTYPQIQIGHANFIDLMSYPELEDKLKKAMDNLKGGKALTGLEALDPQSYSLQLTDNNDYTYDVIVLLNNHSIPFPNISYVPHAKNPQVNIGGKTFALENYPNLKDKLEKALKDLEPKQNPQQLLPLVF